MTTPTGLLTISQAAHRLGISDKTLRNYADKGLVPVIKLPSGYRRFDPAEIERVRQEWTSRGTAQSRSQDVSTNDAGQ